MSNRLLIPFRRAVAPPQRCSQANVFDTERVGSSLRSFPWHSPFVEVNRELPSWPGVHFLALVVFLVFINNEGAGLNSYKHSGSMPRRRGKKKMVKTPTDFLIAAYNAR